jgi:hypothetical protein
MHISEVDFCPQKDQWWARLKPLALIHILESPDPQGETLFDKLRGDHQTLPEPNPIKQIELEPFEQPKQAGLRPDLNRAVGLSLIPNRPTTY